MGSYEQAKDKDKISDEAAAVVEDIHLVVEEGGSAGIYEQSNDQNEISDKVTAAEEILVDVAKDKDKMSDEMASLVEDIQLLVEGGSAGSYEQSNNQNEISDEVTAEGTRSQMK